MNDETPEQYETWKQTISRLQAEVERLRLENEAYPHIQQANQNLAQRLAESEKARQEAEAKLNKQNDTIGFLDLEIKAERVAHEETKKEAETLRKMNGTQQHFYAEMLQAYAERDSLAAQLKQLTVLLHFPIEPWLEPATDCIRAAIDDKLK